MNANHPTPLLHPDLIPMESHEVSNLLNPIARHYGSILETISPTHILIKKSIHSAWNMLAYHTHFPHDSKEQEHAISAVMHKLTCVGIQIQKLESSICEPLLKRMNYEKGYNGPLRSDVIETLQTIKKRLSTALQIIAPDHTFQEICAASSWKKLHSELDIDIAIHPAPSIETLNDLTARMHKLIPSYCHLRMLEVNAYQHIFNQLVLSEKDPSPLANPPSKKKSKVAKTKDTTPQTFIAANSQSSPLPPPSPKSQLLHKVCLMKQQLSEVANVMYPWHSIAQRVVISGWDSLEPLMANDPPTSPKDLSLYSSIMHKVTITSNHIGSTELKLFDRFFKHYFAQPKYQKPKDALPYFTPEQRKQFEEDCKRTFGAVPSVPGLN